MRVLCISQRAAWAARAVLLRQRNIQVSELRLLMLLCVLLRIAFVHLQPGSLGVVKGEKHHTGPVCIKMRDFIFVSTRSSGV